MQLRASHWLAANNRQPTLAAGFQKNEPKKTSDINRIPVVMPKIRDQSPNKGELKNSNKNAAIQRNVRHCDGANVTKIHILGIHFRKQMYLLPPHHGHHRANLMPLDPLNRKAVLIIFYRSYGTMLHHCGGARSRGLFHRWLTNLFSGGAARAACICCTASA